MTITGAALAFMVAGSDRLVEGPPPSVPRKRTSSKSGVIALSLFLLVLVWVAFPVFVRNPNAILMLTSAGSAGQYTLTLQNLSPWPIFVNGQWGFSPPITWLGSRPTNELALMPFAAYTFEYTTGCLSEVVGVHCPVVAITSYVTFSGDVTVLYRTFQVTIRSTNYGN